MSLYLRPQYPKTRMRRMRQDSWSRALISEHHLRPENLIQPLFIAAESSSIGSMPGVMRMSLKDVDAQIDKALLAGVRCFALFPHIDPTKKDAAGSEALNPDGLIPQALRHVSKKFPEVGLIADIALDPYTSHGHDGLVDQAGHIANDRSIDVFCKQALLCAEAGANTLAPSDMMDGRIAAIRQSLDQNGFESVRILSYAAKFCSSFYGPFRQAIGSDKNLAKASKESYQLDPANAEESMHEVALDISEGADMIMIKPAMAYLDIIYRIRSTFALPTIAYQVSGEYAMIKTAAQHGYIDERACVLESLTAMRRAGAQGVISYYATEAAQWLQGGIN